MSRRLYSAALLVAALLVAGCGRSFFNDSQSNTMIGSGPYVQGSGKAATESRALGSFHALAVANGMTVTVKLGAAPSAEVTADDNLLGMILTTVEDGTLTVSVDGSLTTHNPLRVTVTAPAGLDSIEQNGGTTVDFESAAGSLEVSVNAGSTLRAGGKVSNLEVAVSSGSTADLRNVEAAVARVEVNSGSTARLNVSQSLSGRCAGGSTLFVSGSASLDAVGKDAGSTVRRG
jgi:predicted small secreted protein